MPEKAYKIAHEVVELDMKFELQEKRMTDDNAFKICPGCNQIWETRNDYLNDETLVLNGYKADFKALEYGMFFFTHRVEGCCSTMVLLVNEFQDLYTGPLYPENKAISEECPRYCMDENELSRCDALCECAFAREIMHLINNR